MALIWDTGDMLPENKAPIMKYNAEKPVTNIQWGINEKNWVGICSGNELKLIKVNNSKKGI